MLPVAQNLHAHGRLVPRAQSLRRLLSSCTLCPRLCKVDRLAGEIGICGVGALARIASYGPHFGEEEVLVGRNGSGTIFMAGCNLHCCFCQNHEISRPQAAGQTVDAHDFAAIMLELQSMGCSNINIVTPTHVAPQLLDALIIAIEQGLRIPLVYNCGGYERRAVLELLDGCIDIYMPDVKFWLPATAERYASAPDYPSRMQEAVMCMHGQVGDLKLDADGIARSGLLVRHLLMPGLLEETAAIMNFIGREVSTDTYINVMGQYRPCGSASSYPELDRRLTGREYQAGVESAHKAGLHRLDARSPLLFGK